MLHDKTVYFLGKLKASNRAKASQVVRTCGGTVARELSESVNIVVVGEGDILSYNWNVWNDQLDNATQKAFESGRLEIISEAFFWCKYDKEQSLENSDLTKSFFTPSMLSEITKLPLAVIRQLERCQLILPMRQIYRLNYYDAESVLILRIVRNLLDSGAPPKYAMNILKKIKRNSTNKNFYKTSDIQCNGKELFIVTKNGTVDLDGQHLFQFVTNSEYSDNSDNADNSEYSSIDISNQLESNRQILLKQKLEDHTELEQLTSKLKSDQSDFLSLSVLDNIFKSDELQAQSHIQELYDTACYAELSGNIKLTIEIYRTIIVMSGSTPQLNFQIAELLYRQGELSAARERYFIALEQDEEFVEARANLGCVLAELGEDQLAMAAFQGALKYHPDYAEVHFHLGMLLKRIGLINNAIEHLQLFIDLIPDSPWSSKAQNAINDLENITKK
ncbi:MAG: tetratricopeptide repeat protein [Planctomycetaceae bacterium]|jgi:tetratricopeptide (TPR) repeat protein|nr:tetratricopeptide repeat protein [Planctomycetaceae bacterium]